jgi:hypothetical protein
LQAGRDPNSGQYRGLTNCPHHAHPPVLTLTVWPSAPWSTLEDLGRHPENVSKTGETVSRSIKDSDRISRLVFLSKARQDPRVKYAQEETGKRRLKGKGSEGWMK